MMVCRCFLFLSSRKFENEDEERWGMELLVKKAGRKNLVRVERDPLEASSILSCGRRLGLWNVAKCGLF